MKCENCKFLDTKRGTYPEGHIWSGAEWINYNCHRYPPQRNSIGTDWPAVKPDDWCGEYEGKYT